MHRKLLVLSIMTAFVLLGFGYDARQPSAIAPAQSVVAPAASAGMILNIDPTTGAIVEEAGPTATKLAVPADLAERWSTNDEGLVEKPNPSGGKGMYMNLEGRFENGMVATVDVDGNLAVPCAQGLNTAADRAANQK